MYDPDRYDLIMSTIIIVLAITLVFLLIWR